MLGALGAFALWLLQIVGTWGLVGVTVVALFLRLSFSAFALARTVVTAAVVLTMAYRYGLTTDGAFDWVDAVIVKYGLLAIVAGAVLLVLAGVYVLVGPPGTRRSRLGRLFRVAVDGNGNGEGDGDGDGFKIPGPLSVLALAGATTGVVAWQMSAMDTYDNAFVRVITSILILLPAGVFLLLAPFSVAGTVFNAANAHPALPALAAPFVTVGAVIVDRFSDGVVATPDNLKEPFALTGLLIATALSAIELLRLKRRGLTLAQDEETARGPLPGPLPGPSPAPDSRRGTGAADPR